MKLRDWLDQNREFFGESDLRFLITDIFQDNVKVLLENPDINKKRLDRLNNIKNLYSCAIPMAYILGKEEFFGLEFKVTPQVLVPRKETELIVEKAVELIKNNKIKTVLDLCSGSGNIGISLKYFCQEISVVCSDISKEALAVAALNSRYHNKAVNLIRADLLSGFQQESFDLIISNPPYVEAAAIKGSLKYEPQIALWAGDDGLFFIRKILNAAFRYLKRDGYLVIEFGYCHKDYIENIITDLGVYQLIEWIKDYSGYWRGGILKKGYG